MQFEDFKERYQNLAGDAPDLQATDAELAKMFLALIVLEQDREAQFKKEMKKQFQRDMRER